MRQAAQPRWEHEHSVTIQLPESLKKTIGALAAKEG